MLYLIEVDRGLAGRLVARYADAPHVRVLVGDVLELPLHELIAAPRATVVANLPYNIASPVLFRLLEHARFLAGGDEHLELFFRVDERVAARAAQSDHVDDGPADPVASAPSTANGRKLEDRHAAVRKPARSRSTKARS